MQGCFQLKELALNFTYMTFAVNHDRDSELLLKRKLNYLGTEALFQTEESEFATTAYHEKMHRLGLLTWSNAIVFKYITVHSIGDNVFIASGAKIIGDVFVASDCAIAANAVVVKDITVPGTTWGAFLPPKLVITILIVICACIKKRKQTI